MKRLRFKAEVLSGHKQDAVEVPFDPAKEWSLAPKPLWRGRRGFAVKAIMNGVRFESAIVPRQKKYYLLIDAEAGGAAKVSEGSAVDVVIEPDTGFGLKVKR